MDEHESVEKSVDDKNKYLVPSSIIFAGVLVALAVIYSGGTGNFAGGQGANVADVNTPSEADGMRPVDSFDHILGNPDAPIKVVEYSDLECPFCKTYHPTLKQIISEYGGDGKVAWVYRHLPLDSIHPKARKEAEASECAAELGGNNAFWAYIDKIFAVTPSNNGLDLAKLPQIAGDIGLDKAKFQECLSSGRHAQKIEDSFQDAIAAGGDGTPYTVIVTSGGKKIPFSGALPLAQVKGLIDEAIKSL